jgi:S-formylglutathione hydrolase FrmB
MLQLSAVRGPPDATPRLLLPVQRTGYLSDRSEWTQYDATELMSNITPEAKNAFDDILIDVGTADNFLSGGQLLPEVRHRV